MTTRPAGKIWTACHSALQLDRYLLGELDPPAAATLRAHLAGCALCTSATGALAPDGTALPPLKLVPLRPAVPAPESAFAPLLTPAPTLLTDTRSSLTQAGVDAERGDPKLPASSFQLPSHSGDSKSRSHWRRWGLASAALAAASLLLVLLPPLRGERLKGSAGPTLTMYVQHQGEVRRAAPGEQVAAGDAVRFAVTSSRDAWVAVLSLDPRGRASVYFPLGDRAERVSGGAEVALPLSTQLDATVGEEHLLGLFCPAPVELEPVRSKLESGAATIPEGCQVTRWSFVKH